MADLRRHSDEGWVQEGMILYYETPSLQTAKVFSGLREGQKLVLPKDAQTKVELDIRILLKFRMRSRCFFCKALVVAVQEDSFTVELPNNYQSLPRRCFYRLEISRSGRFNEEDACVKDLSVSGAAIEVPHSDGLEIGGRYRFQLGRFSTFATINEISGNLIRVQFAIRDNLSQELNRIVRDTYRLRKRQEIEHIRDRKTIIFAEC